METRAACNNDISAPQKWFPPMQKNTANVQRTNDTLVFVLQYCRNPKKPWYNNKIYQAHVCLSQQKQAMWVLFSQPLTVHLKSVGLEKFLVAVCVTGVVAHVGCCHLGNVQRAVISKVLPDRVRNKRGGGKQLLITQKTHRWFSAAVTAEEV